MIDNHMLPLQHNKAVSALQGTETLTQLTAWLMSHLVSDIHSFH